MTINERRELNKKWYNEQMSSSEENNAKIFTRQVSEKCGRFVETEIGKYGFCVGMTLGDDDYYWLIINQDRKIEYHSAVCDMDYLEGDTIPSELFVLNYLLENDEDSIIQIVKESIEKNSDYLFTPIFLKNKIVKI